MNLNVINLNNEINQNPFYEGPKITNIDAQFKGRGKHTDCCWGHTEGASQIFDIYCKYRKDQTEVQKSVGAIRNVKLVNQSLCSLAKTFGMASIFSFGAAVPILLGVILACGVCALHRAATTTQIQFKGKIYRVRDKHYKMLLKRLDPDLNTKQKLSSHDLEQKIIQYVKLNHAMLPDYR